MTTQPSLHTFCGKFLLAVSLSVFAADFTQAQTFLLDLNDKADTGDGNTYSGGYPGGPSAWNQYATPADMQGVALADSSGSTSAGLEISWEGTMKDSSNGNSNTFNNSTGGPSWVTTDGSLANTGAAADYFFTSTGNKTYFTITFDNLTLGDEVSIDLWFSRVGESNARGYYEYSLDNGSNWNGFTVLEKDGSLSTTDGWDTNTTHSVTGEAWEAGRDGNNQGRYMNASSLIIGSSESLQVKVSDPVAGNWSSLGAARLTVIPEPSSIALVTIAFLGLLGFTRKKA
ncbi:PEP-CTERM sorting domain-containing protein [Kiritimatiellota bacterium B12222]|nr:PEP-CTERM sorting domain-containing protein [Kiritimatiellota bacterium B12222]